MKLLGNYILIEKVEEPQHSTLFLLSNDRKNLARVIHTGNKVQKIKPGDLVIYNHILAKNYNEQRQQFIITKYDVFASIKK